MPHKELPTTPSSSDEEYNLFEVIKPSRYDSTDDIKQFDRKSNEENISKEQSNQSLKEENGERGILYFQKAWYSKKQMEHIQNLRVTMPE